MDANTIIILIGIATLFITMIGIGVAVIIHFSKKTDEIRDRLSKIESKLDISDITNQSANQRIDKLEVDFKELKTDIKNIYTK